MQRPSRSLFRLLWRGLFGSRSQRLIKLAASNKLKKIGAHTYLIFAKTAESFIPKEVDIFGAARKEGYPIILFTNKEVEPYRPYYNGDEQEQLPHRYVHSFSEMVRNTEFPYSKLKPATGDTGSSGA